MPAEWPMSSGSSGCPQKRPRSQPDSNRSLPIREIGVVSFVIFMPLRGTALEGAKPPALARVAEVLAFARARMPDGVHSLGCARPRDRYGERVEAVALMAGVERLAVPTDGAEAAARALGLQVDRQDTCCSVDLLP